MSLVVDANVSLKWVLQEPDSALADALLSGRESLAVPDFWLNEATSVLWVQVRRGVFTPAEAREGLALLRPLTEPTPTLGLGLHDVALDIGFTVKQPTYDTLYLAFSIAVGARGLVVPDGPFVAAVRGGGDPALAALILPLAGWARGEGVASVTTSWLWHGLARLGRRLGRRRCLG